MIPFLTLVVISLICFVAQFEPIANLFIWDRGLIGTHYEWWRIITGNLTHTNWPHFTMNIVALWLIVAIFRPTSKNLTLSLILLCAWVGTYLLFTPHLDEYVGLSGVLHGLFAYWALLEALHHRRTSWLLVAGVMAKVLWEQCIGPSSLTTELINAPIAVNAHLAGLLGGFLLAIVQQTWLRFQR